MKFPRVRFTLRRMMIAVAVVALLLAAPQMIQLIRRDAQEKAAYAEWSNLAHWLND
jgi:Tfp pilus assembly protein FimT